MEVKLWCMFIAGPNETHAAPDYWKALAWAAELNAVIAKRAISDNWAEDDNYPLTQATVQPWPWSAEDHASNLAEELAERTAHEQRRRDASILKSPALENVASGAAS